MDGLLFELTSKHFLLYALSHMHTQNHIQQENCCFIPFVSFQDLSQSVVLRELWALSSAIN